MRRCRRAVGGKKAFRKPGSQGNADGTLSLTELGLQLAEQIYEKHLFFTKQLILAGVDPETAEQDACGIEHAVSSESFQKLKKAFDDG